MNIGSFSWWFHEKFLNLQRIISKTEEVWSSNIKEKEPKKSLSLGSNRLLPRKKNGWRLIIWKSGVTCVVNFMHVEIEAEGVMNFAAIIVQKSNPCLETIIADFRSAIEELQKPN